MKDYLNVTILELEKDLIQNYWYTIGIKTNNRNTPRFHAVIFNMLRCESFLISELCDWKHKIE